MLRPRLFLSQISVILRWRYDLCDMLYTDNHNSQSAPRRPDRGSLLQHHNCGNYFLTRISGRATITDKIAGQMGPRGWTEQQIGEAIKSGQQIRAINKATGNPAIRYVHPETGKSVVVDTVTNEVIQIDRPGFLHGPSGGDLP